MRGHVDAPEHVNFCFSEKSREYHASGCGIDEAWPWHFISWRKLLYPAALFSDSPESYFLLSYYKSANLLQDSTHQRMLMSGDNWCLMDCKCGINYRIWSRASTCTKKSQVTHPGVHQPHSHLSKLNLITADTSSFLLLFPFAFVFLGVFLSFFETAEDSTFLG